MIYYKFCSSMLSSTVDLQGELTSSTWQFQGRQSRRRAIGPRNNGPARDRANELVESRSLATAASSEARKR